MSNGMGNIIAGNTRENPQETSLNKVKQFSYTPISEIENLEKDANQEKINKETHALKSSVETMQYGNNQLISLEYLKDSPLKETMLSVLTHQDFDQVEELQNKTPEQRVELIFRKINIGLTRFYARKFNLTPEQGVPPYLEKVILPATEWFLMDLLGKTGQKMNVNFLASLSEMSFEKVGQIFQDIKTFSDSFMLPFAQAKALLNLSDFLALPKNRQELEKLDSPYDFYEKVMKNPVWTKELVSEPVKAGDQDKKVNIHELKRGDFGLTSSSELSEAEQQQHLETEKEKIKQEIWTIPMVNSPETVKKLLSVLEKTDSYFEKTDLMREQLLDQAEGVWTVNSSIKDFLGFDLLKEIKNTPLASFVNFFLGIIGFSWGIEGITRGVLQRKLDREMKKPQKDAITELYSDYQKEKKLTDMTAKDLLDSYQLKVAEQEVSKFAVDLPVLKTQLVEKIQTQPELLNLNTLRSLESKEGFKGKDLVEEVSVGKEKHLQLKASLNSEQQEQAVDLYLQTMLQHFTNPKKSDLLKTFESSDDLVFALVAGLFVDKKNVMDGMEAGVLFPSQFYETNNTHIENQPDKSNQNLSCTSNEWLIFADSVTDTQKQKINNELKNSPLNTEMVVNSCKKYWIPISYLMAVVKNDSSYWTAWLWAKTHNPWNVGNTDNGSKRHFSSREEWLDAAAKVLKDRVEAYRKEYGDVKYPPIQNLLENRWPDGNGFLPSQGNYRQNNPYRSNPNKAPLWAYMTAVNWPQQVAKITQSLNSELWLTLT